jgi:hypothetical protein
MGDGGWGVTSFKILFSIEPIWDLLNRCVTALA